MLELSMIQSTSRPKDAGAHSSEKLVGKNDKEDVGQDFQNEYNSVKQAKENAEESGGTPEQTREIEADKDAAPEAAKRLDHAEITDPDVNDVVDTDVEVEEFLTQVRVSNAIGDPRNWAASTIGTAPVQVETRIHHNDTRESFGTPGEKRSALLRPTDTPTETIAGPAAAKPLATANNTTAEAVFMTKAAENATNFALATSPYGSKFRDQAGSAVSEVALSAIQSHNTAASTAEFTKAEIASPRDMGRIPSAEDLPRGIELRRDPTIQPPLQATAAIEAKPMQSPAIPLTKPPVAKEKSELLFPVLSELEVVGVSTARPADHVATTALNQVLNRAETPTMIARQMAEALQRLPDRPVEISLNPKELGRVRMNISAAETGITVSVIAERPETLDLMRRNIEQLTSEFKALGYDNINFAFAEGEAKNSFGKDDKDQSGSSVSHLEVMTDEEDVNTPRHPLAVTSGVDIRL